MTNNNIEAYLHERTGNRLEVFHQLYNWLVLEHKDTAIDMAGFILKNILPENGGVCTVAGGNIHMADVVETSNIMMMEIGVEVDNVALELEYYGSMNMGDFCERRLNADLLTGVVIMRSLKM